MKGKKIRGGGKLTYLIDKIIDNVTYKPVLSDNNFIYTEISDDLLPVNYDDLELGYINESYVLAKVRHNGTNILQKLTIVNFDENKYNNLTVVYKYE
jgi:hypothetical protein